MNGSRLLMARFLFGTIYAAALLASAPAQSETLSGTVADARTTIAMRVDAAAAQHWLPKPWLVRPMPKGPFKGANLLIVLIDRLLHQDAQGKPVEGGSYRRVALLIPAVDPVNKRAVPFVVRVYSVQGGPGPYRNSLQAAVRRETIQHRQDAAPGTGTERWSITPASGGALVFAMTYLRAVPKRMKLELRPRSAVDPTFERIYRYEQVIDVVFSRPATIDRVRGLRLSVTIPELRAMFDGKETLIGVAQIPWYTRQTLLP